MTYFCTKKPGNIKQCYRNESLDRKGRVFSVNLKIEGESFE